MLMKHFLTNRQVPTSLLIGQYILQHLKQQHHQRFLTFSFKRALKAFVCNNILLLVYSNKNLGKKPLNIQHFINFRNIDL